MDKPIIPKQLADAIEEVREKEGRVWTRDIKIDFLDRRFLQDADDEWDAVTTINRYLEESIENVATYYFAVKYEYEVEKTLADKVRELYAKEIAHSKDHPGYQVLQNHRQGFKEGVVATLDALGFKIEGVNSP